MTTIYLLSTVHYIQSTFDSSLQVQVFFLDISKVFEKALDPSLLFKLSSYGVECNIFKLSENSLQLETKICTRWSVLVLEKIYLLLFSTGLMSG